MDIKLYHFYRADYERKTQILFISNEAGLYRNIEGDMVFDGDLIGGFIHKNPRYKSPCSDWYFDSYECTNIVEISYYEAMETLMRMMAEYSQKTIKEVIDSIRRIYFSEALKY